MGFFSFCFSDFVYFHFSRCHLHTPFYSTDVIGFDLPFLVICAVIPKGECERKRKKENNQAEIFMFNQIKRKELNVYKYIICMYLYIVGALIEIYVYTYITVL